MTYLEIWLCHLGEMTYIFCALLMFAKLGMMMVATSCDIGSIRRNRERWRLHRRTGRQVNADGAYNNLNGRRIPS